MAQNRGMSVYVWVPKRQIWGVTRKLKFMTTASTWEIESIRMGTTKIKRNQRKNWPTTEGYKLNNIWWSKELSKQSKQNVYNTIVETSSEMW